MMDLKNLFVYSFLLLFLTSYANESERTIVTIKGEKFLINSVVTMKGRYIDGSPLEGLLSNSRMVQGILDDLNPEPRHFGNIPIQGSGIRKETQESLSPFQYLISQLNCRIHKNPK